MLVSLVGYTNAGKSTLMNSLTGAEVYVADQLFATLDTRTRKWSIPTWGSVLLSDTVGFVRDLPHQLVASFKSTLEEARQASLLLHVVDASNPEAEQQVATVEEVLSEINVDISNSILVLNKADSIVEPGMIDVLRSRYAHSVTVSAKTGLGLAKLGIAVAERLSNGFVNVRLQSKVDNGKLFAFLAERAEISETTYADDIVFLTCRVDQKAFTRLQSDPSVLKMESLSSGTSSSSSDEPHSSNYQPH